MLNTYKATELIQKLQTLVDTYGDLHVVAADADTSWRLPIGIVYRDMDTNEEWEARFEIKTCYHGAPPGSVTDE